MQPQEHARSLDHLPPLPRDGPRRHPPNLGHSPSKLWRRPGRHVQRVLQVVSVGELARKLRVLDHRVAHLSARVCQLCGDTDRCEGRTNHHEDCSVDIRREVSLVKHQGAKRVKHPDVKRLKGRVLERRGVQGPVGSHIGSELHCGEWRIHVHTREPSGSESRLADSSRGRTV